MLCAALLLTFAVVAAAVAVGVGVLVAAVVVAIVELRASSLLTTATGRV